MVALIGAAIAWYAWHQRTQRAAAA